MAYLFRAYSDQSQGINTPILIAPGTATTHVPITTYDPPKRNATELGQQLKDALAWKKIPSPFIFWTASLFFALQVARSRSRKGETNVRIVALDVDTAETVGDKKKKVTFTLVPGMLKEFGVRLEKKTKDGSEYEYSNEILTMDCVVPGGKSRTVDFETLELYGLHQLYPALECVFERDDGRTRLHRNTVALRRFHFRDEQCLTSGRLGVAIHLATKFVTRPGHGDEVDLTILAHLLAIRKRSPGDSVLKSWVKLNTLESSKIDEEGDEDPKFTTMIEAIDVEEVNQFRELEYLFKDKYISSRALNLTTGTVSQHEIEAERADWNRWATQQREEYRVMREARPDFDPNFKRRERRPPRGIPGSTSNNARDAAYAARRASRVWLPREQYEAERAARGVHRGGRASWGESNRVPSLVSRGVLQPRGVNKTKRYGDGSSKRVGRASR